jgi:hypothetical protein
MTKNEFINAAYLAALPTVAQRLIKENYPAQDDQTLSQGIASLTVWIAEKSFQEMEAYLESESYTLKGAQKSRTSNKTSK